jgi:hypothetical protein
MPTLRKGFFWGVLSHSVKPEGFEKPQGEKLPDF